jgi:hypothetical protein
MELRMAKIVFQDLARNKGKSSNVRKQRVRTDDGRWKTIHTLDANSASFDRDLQYVFDKNIAKARRENRRLLGSAGDVRSKD